MAGWNRREVSDMAETVTTFEAKNVAEEAQEPQAETAAEAAAPQDTPTDPRPAPQPQAEPVPTPTLVPRLPNPPPVSLNPVPIPPVQPPPSAPAPAPAPATPARTYGPPDTGGSNVGSDSQRVGTASNGAPLYAARWYREPTRQEMSGYLSTASGPGTALIACRTVPNFRVEDCELLGESPQGSQIGRAVLAAAWQFRVRPARIGGQSQVGSWVRIRIDYRESVRR